MGRPVLERLRSDVVIECRNCRAHFTTPSTLVSRLFQASTGRASLYTKAHNLDYGPEVKRSMTTGLHAIKEASCRGCGTLVGWTYVKAYEGDQKYKEGKIILERALVVEVDEKNGKCLDENVPKDWTVKAPVQMNCEQLVMRI